jgi:glucose/mannose-6-phosphate isomerase
MHPFRFAMHLPGSRVSSLPGSPLVDEDRLDDPAALEAADPGQMLRAVATSAAQIRESADLARAADLGRLGDAGRPRAVVVAGMGGSGIVGDVLAAVAGESCPVPVVVHRGYGLPGWVGAADLLIAVSSSGATEETLSATDEGLRRGVGFMAVGAANSPLAERAAQARAPYVAIDARGRLPRACLWSLATPLLVAGDALRVLSLPGDALEAAAARLVDVAQACRPDRESFVNPAKALALSLPGSLPMIWGAGQVAAVAAYRFACQINENAKLPAMSGMIPEANHNQVVAFDGPLAAGAPDDDIFRDRVEEAAAPRLQLLLLRDPAGEHPQVTRRADASRELAADRGMRVQELVAEGSAPLERLASLVGLVDYASVYLALLQGIDPSPIDSITALKRRIR